MCVCCASSDLNEIKRCTHSLDVYCLSYGQSVFFILLIFELMGFLASRALCKWYEKDCIPQSRCQQAIFFFPKVYKYNIVTDIIHNTFPLGQTGVYICVLNHVKKKKKSFCFTSKITSKVEKVLPLVNCSERGARCLLLSVSGISGKMNTMGCAQHLRKLDFFAVCHQVCVRYLAYV